MSSKAPFKNTINTLNQIAPDTFDEGEHGPWTFIALKNEGATWTLYFEGGSVAFPYAGKCEDDDGEMSTPWYEEGLMPAIAAWEDSANDPEVVANDSGELHVKVTAAELKRRQEES